jgi:hypothetical protein
VCVEYERTERVKDNETNPLEIVRGVRKIAKATHNTERRTYYLLSKGLLPALKEGSVWVTTMGRLRDFYGGGPEKESGP